MRVWIDQDLCTGDGLCTDHCPDVFVLLEDGLSYVRHHTGSPANDPGGRASIVTVPERLVDPVIAAALDCPGECIFLEDDESPESDDTDIVDAELIDRAVAGSGNFDRSRCTDDRSRTGGGAEMPERT